MRAYRGQTSMDQMAYTQSTRGVYRTRAARPCQPTYAHQAAEDQLNGIQHGIRSVALIAAIIISPLMIALALSIPEAESFIGSVIEYGIKVSSGSQSSVGADGINDGTQNESTPQDQWMLGTMPTLYQTDPAWANIPYGDGTIETHGCGPTCLSMVYIDLTGKKDLNPAQMADFATREAYLDTGVTSWLFMTEGAREIGLTSRELPASKSIVMDELRGGNPVICSVGKGDFTTDGHFIVLSEAGQDGRVRVHDPNSAARSNISWDLDQVLAQCRNLWAFSA